VREAGENGTSALSALLSAFAFRHQSWRRFAVSFLQGLSSGMQMGTFTACLTLRSCGKDTLLFMHWQDLRISSYACVILYFYTQVVSRWFDEWHRDYEKSSMDCRSEVFETRRRCLS